MNFQNLSASSMQLISYGKDKGDFNKSYFLAQDSNYRAYTPEKKSHAHQFAYSQQKDIRREQEKS